MKILSNEISNEIFNEGHELAIKNWVDF